MSTSIHYSPSWEYHDERKLRTEALRAAYAGLNDAERSEMDIIIGDLEMLCGKTRLGFNGALEVIAQLGALLNARHR